MRKVRFVVIASLIATSLLLSCGKSSDTAVTISWWQFWTSPDVAPTIDSLISDFERENQDVEVDLGELTWSDGHEKIVISLAAGKGPDVIELGSDWVAEFADAGRLLDITQETTALRDELLMWEPVRYENRIYGVPWMLGTRVLFVNRDLLDQAGYDLNFRPADWDELLQAVRSIDQLGDDVFGFGSNSAERHRLYKKYLPFFWSAGGNVFNHDASGTQFESDAGKKSLAYYLDLAESGLIETQARLDEYFVAGRLGFVISGEWLVKKIVQQNPELDYFVQTLPGPSEAQPGISFAGGEYLVVNAATEHPESAIELLNFLARAGNNARFCRAAGSFTPANRNAGALADSTLRPTAEVFQRQLRNARATPVHPEWVYVEEAIEKGIEQALYGRMSVPEALAEIDRRCGEILQGLNAQ